MQPARILYTNHRGEQAWRRILPDRLWYGYTAWHPEPGWMIDATDIDKGERRSFAVRFIARWEEDRCTNTAPS